MGDLREAHLARYVQMTRAPEGVRRPQAETDKGFPDPTIVIWPETAAPMLLNEAPRVSSCWPQPHPVQP